MIELEQVSKVYRSPDGEVRALDGVSMSVEGGDFVAVQGPSGCGKSTLLLTVGGMIRPTSGRVLIDGRDLYAMSAGERARLRARRIGFVFQLFHLIPYLTALDNVLVPSTAGAAVDAAGARELLERLQLGERLRHRPSELSTGERQRVALARALITEPEIILADEPTGNLDPENSAAVMSYLAEFHERGGTVLVVSHEELAAQYARRTVYLERGRVLDDTVATG
ncbi:MAG: ABC transporter ATP-binding protein [Armatimonadota bacterium]|nr:ABC transporter ATP-binding protein [Armatimonadota bacterium]